MDFWGAVCVFAILVHFSGLLIAVGRTGYRRQASCLAMASPPVTILRPVCGLENNLEETLGSSYGLHYRDYEVVFCVASKTDPVIPLVQRLIRANPERPSRLLVGDDRISVNPKLNNLVKGWNAARHSWILMVDSNVLMPPDLVQRTLDRWTEGTGLVCSPPVGIAPKGFWSEVECAWLNAFQARWQLVADAAGVGFAQGKVMLWRRDILDSAGGIERLANEVAEDAAATKIVRNAGLSVRLVDRPFPQPLGRRTAREVWRRQLRWARLRRASFPLFFAPEILAGGAIPIGCATFLAFDGTWSWSMTAGYACLWYLSETLASKAAGWPTSPRSVVAALVRDAALPFLWVAAIVGDSFVWRGNDMAVPGGRARRTVAAPIRGMRDFMPKLRIERAADKSNPARFRRTRRSFSPVKSGPNGQRQQRVADVSDVSLRQTSMPPASRRGEP